MIKKLLLVALLGTITGTQAVLLRDGSSAPRAKADRVYYALKSLYHSNNIQKLMLIVDLEISCKHSPKKLQFFARNILDVINETQRFETAVALDLCDKEGIIDEETAHIILSSVQCGCKGIVPVYIDIRSPISWLAWTEFFKKSSNKK